MKKLLCLFTLSFFVLLSCDKNNETSKKEPTSDVIGFKKIHSTNKNERSHHSMTEDGIVIDLGGKSKNCRGFGVCRIGMEAYANAELKREKDNVFLVAELDRKLDTEILRVDDDIEIENLKLPSGEYSLNNKIGEFGGYKLKLSLTTKDEK